MTASGAAPLVWINGFPGSGKLTVAAQIAALQKAAVVLDNHKLIDPVEAQYPRSHPDYQRQRQLHRKKVFDEYVCGTAMLSRPIIFTDFQSDNELGRDVALEYKDAAAKAGRPFLPVYMICDVDANLERVATCDRVHGGTKKLTNAELLKDLRGRCTLFRFDGCRGLTVDSTAVSPLENAVKILSFLQEERDADQTAAAQLQAERLQDHR